MKMVVGVKYDFCFFFQIDFIQVVVFELFNVLMKVLYIYVGKLRIVFRFNKIIEKNNFFFFWNNFR